MNRLLRHIPNTLTALRLLSAPVLAILILHGRGQWALGVFAFAGLSDAVDGYLAKWLAPGSHFGAWLDPAADKLLMLACFVSLTITGATPLWLMVLVIARDLAIVSAIGLLRLLAIPVVMAPLYIGKANTAVQVGYVALTLALFAFDLQEPALVLSAEAVTAAFTIVSWIGYGRVLLRALSPDRGTA